MARIDIFLDLDDVLQETVVSLPIVDTYALYHAVYRFNRFVDYLQEQGHDVTIIPVTSYRHDIGGDEKKLRGMFEGIGVVAGLPFKVYLGGSRSEVVVRRNAERLSDAHVIFDDNASAYPDKTNLIHVTYNGRKKIGITPVNINQAKIRIVHQLNDAGLPYRNDARLIRPVGKPMPDDMH